MASNFSSSPGTLGASFFPLPIIALRHTHKLAREMWFSYWNIGSLPVWMASSWDYPHCIPWAPLKEEEGRTPAIN